MSLSCPACRACALPSLPRMDIHSTVKQHNILFLFVRTLVLCAIWLLLYLQCLPYSSVPIFTLLHLCTAPRPVILLPPAPHPPKSRDPPFLGSTSPISPLFNSSFLSPSTTTTTSPSPFYSSPRPSSSELVILLAASPDASHYSRSSLGCPSQWLKRRSASRATCPDLAATLLSSPPSTQMPRRRALLRTRVSLPLPMSCKFARPRPREILTVVWPLTLISCQLLDLPQRRRHPLQQVHPLESEIRVPDPPDRMASHLLDHHDPDLGAHHHPP